LTLIEAFVATELFDVALTVALAMVEVFEVELT